MSNTPQIDTKVHEIRLKNLSRIFFGNLEADYKIYIEK